MIMSNKITQEDVQKIIDASEFEVFHAVFDKQCIVVAKLPNGFTIIGDSACVDPANYAEELGLSIAMERVKSKIWELEGYRLQCELSK